MTALVILFFVAVWAGIQNALAGGGTFLTLPALMLTDMTALAAKGLPGLPDGMTVDERGNLWASGPGGIHVLVPDGRELGRIARDVAISNCTFGGPDGSTLFITANHNLLRIKTNTKGANF